MFSKITLVFEKSSLIGCFGLAIATSGLIVLTNLIRTKRHNFAAILGIPLIVLGIMIILNNEKVTLFLVRCSEYLLSFLP